jgi:hypothetical protein
MARVMQRPALVTSALLHGGLLLATLIAWPWMQKPVEPTPEPVAVELISDLPQSPGPVSDTIVYEEPVPEVSENFDMPDLAAPPPPAAISADLPPVPDDPVPEAVPSLSPTAVLKPPKALPRIDVPKLPGIADTPTPSTKPGVKGGFDLDAIADSVGKSKGAAPSKPKPSGGAQSLSGPELDALKAKMYQCWNPDCGAAGADGYAVRVRIVLGRDGGLTRSPELMDKARIAAGGRAYQAAAERALRAVERCAPYTLPDDRYEAWREIVMYFNPKEVCS